MAHLSTREMTKLYGGERDDHVAVLDRGLERIVEEARTRTPKKVANSEVETERLRKWLQQKVRAGESVEIITITPVLAQLLLELNTKNRRQSKSNRRVLGREIADGRFKFNGATVVVTDTGILGDGQHRLEEVIATGVPIRSVLVFGVEEDAIYTIDTNVPKQPAHFLDMMGVADASAIATVASLIWQWKTHNRLAQSSKLRPTKTQVREAACEYKGVAESIAFCRIPGATAVASTAVLAVCHWAISRRADRERADHFINKLAKGDYRLADDNPIVYARNRLVDLKGRTFAHERVSLIFQAWNHHHAGERTSLLRVGKTLPVLEG